MNLAQSAVAGGFYKLPEPTVRVYKQELDVPEYRPWSSLLAGAGGAVSSSPLHHKINEKALPSFKPGKRNYALLNFGRFVCSKRVLRLASEEGFLTPAHPRAVLKAADEFDSGLPEDLALKPPYSLVTLTELFRDYGEEYVLRVEWDKELKRSPGAVHYSYGWEPEYWFLFEA